MRRLLTLLAAAALSVSAFVLPVSAEPTTTGTWAQYPSGATVYQAEVQQPINTANTSNWSSKSKGAIPVMFKLSAGVGPAAFESIYGDATDDNDFAFVSFTPSPSITASEITNLSTDYEFTLGDCHGGSLRWQIRTSQTQAVFVYYGAAPQFGNGGVDGCTGTGTNSVDQSGVNMIGQPDLRYDTSQYAGGTFYDSYEHAMELIGHLPVVRASLVIDSGWQNGDWLPGVPDGTGNQRLNVSNTMVNDNPYDFVSAGGSDFTPTCDLPAADIRLTKSDPTPDGIINEEPVQQNLVDNGTAFRVVDCKYQYILSIPALKTATNPTIAGTYRIEILIDGTSVPTPGSPGGQVKVDIK